MQKPKKKSIASQLFINSFLTLSVIAFAFFLVACKNDATPPISKEAIAREVLRAYDRDETYPYGGNDITWKKVSTKESIQSRFHYKDTLIKRGTSLFQAIRLFYKDSLLHSYEHKLYQRDTMLGKAYILEATGLKRRSDKKLFTFTKDYYSLIFWTSSGRDTEYKTDIKNDDIVIIVNNYNRRFWVLTKPQAIESPYIIEAPHTSIFFPHDEILILSYSLSPTIVKTIDTKATLTQFSRDDMRSFEVSINVPPPN